MNVISILLVGVSIMLCVWCLNSGMLVFFFILVIWWFIVEMVMCSCLVVVVRELVWLIW